MVTRGSALVPTLVSAEAPLSPDHRILAPPLVSAAAMCNILIRVIKLRALNLEM